MNRRQLLAGLPLAGLAAPAFAQAPPPVATPTAPAQPRPALALLPPPTLPATIVAGGLRFPEGPVVMNDGSLLFVEIQSRSINRLSAAGYVSLTAQLDGGPNGLAIGPDQALYIANNGGRFSFNLRDGLTFPGQAPPEHVGGMIQRMDLNTGRVITLYDRCEGRRLVSPDDLVFDRQGGMWISDYGKAGGDGGVFYARPDGSGIRLVKGGLTAPNGIGLSPDGSRLHVSMGQALYTWTIAGPGELSPGSAYPDGVQGRITGRSVCDSLKVLADGRVAVCTLLAGGISIFDSAGKVEFIQCGDRMTTNIAFGGADMRDAWLTYSTTGRIAKMRWPYPGLAPAYRA